MTVFFEQQLLALRIEPNARIRAGNQLQNERMSFDDDGQGDNLINAGIG